MANVFRSLLDAVIKQYNLTLPTYTDGDQTNLQTDSRGRLIVSVGAGSVTITTGQADGSTFTEGSDAVAPLGGFYDDDAASITDEKVGVLRATAKRALHVNLRDAAGAEWNAANPLPVEIVTTATPEDTPLVDTSFGTVTKHCAKASAGIMRSLFATNQNAAARWLQIHNKATDPAGTNVPIMSFQIPAGTATAPGVLIIGSDFLGAEGFPCGTGVAWAISTTRATFTDSATATDHDVNAVYE